MAPEPSILQLVYDSVKEIRAQTATIAEEQVVQGRRLEAATGQMAMINHRLDAADRDRAKLEQRLGDVETGMHDLKRVAWVMTAAGGMVVAVATAVASDAVGRWLDPPRPLPAVKDVVVHTEGG